MAISGSVVGREVVAIMVQSGQSWNTEDTSAGTALYAEDFGLSYSQALDDVPINAGIWQREVDNGTIAAEVNYSAPLEFDEIRGLAGMLGDGSYVTMAETNSGKGDWIHIIKPSGDNFGDFFTFAVQKGNDIINVVPSLKFTGFTLSGQASPNRMMISYSAIGSKVDNASTGITANDFASPSYLTGNGGRAYFRNLSVFINDQSAATLDTVDEISNLITGIEFSSQRALSQDYTNTSGLSMEEPVEDGMMETTCRLDFRTQDSTGSGLFDDLVAGTKKKLKLQVTGNAASSATGSVANASFTVECPHVRVGEDDFPNLSGEGRQTNSLTLRVLGAVTTSDASGMPFTEPYKVTVVNNQSSKQVT